MRKSALRLAWAVGAAALFAVLPALKLASFGTPDEIETPLPLAGIDPDLEEQIPLVDATQTPDTRTFVVWFNSPSPAEVLTHPKIRIKFGQSDMKFDHPTTGQIEVIGSPCRYEPEPGSGISAGRSITFERQGDCRGPSSKPTGEFKMTLVMGGPGNVSLYVKKLPPEQRAPGLLYVQDLADGPGTTAVRGAFIDYMPNGGLTRARLLSFLWTGSSRGQIAWVVLAVATGLVAAGVLLIPLATMPDEPGERRRFRRRVIAASFCLSSAFASSYAIVVPPMQASDETHHLVSYGSLIRPDSIRDETQAWATRNHVERIRRGASQKFRPKDVDRPSETTTRLAPPKTSDRSALTARYWGLLTRLLPTQSIQQLLLTLRLLNAVVFGLSVAAATAMLMTFSEVRYPQLLMMPFLWVPALPFFGVMLGEVALVTAVSVIFAACVLVLFLDSERAHWIGLPLGAASACLIIGSRSSLPMIVMIAAVMAARILIGPRDPANKLGARIFWGGFAVAAAIVTLLLRDRAVQEALYQNLYFIVTLKLWVNGEIPGYVAVPMRLLTSSWLLVIGAAVGWALEWLLTPLRAWLARLLRESIATPIARAIGFAGVAAITISILGSIWLVYPFADTVETPLRAPMLEYVRQVLWTMATVFRVGSHSIPLTATFWVGFGWLDAMPQGALLSIVVLATGVMLAGLLGWLAVKVEGRRLAYLVALLVGLVPTLAVYAISAYQLPTNLHGRYILGWYLILIGLAWMFPAIAGPSPIVKRRPDLIGLRPAVLIAASLMVHAYCLGFVLERYF